jgi:hypothetical protein
MKKVFNGSGVAHAWAAAINSDSNTQDARNSAKSSWFNNRVLYSYSTPIAVITKAPRTNEPIALLSSESYSSTTGRHLSDASSAVRHFLYTFRVPYLAGVASEGRYRAPCDAYSNEERAKAVKIAHASNVAYLRAEYDKAVGSMTRMRGTLHYNRVDLTSRLFAMTTDLLNYCDVFGVERAPLDVGGDAAKVWAAHEKREARYADPLYGEKLRIARDKREAAAERKAERDKLAAIEKLRDARLQFRAGQYNQTRIDSEHGGAMLRLSADGAHAETSWGISDFPAKLARTIVANYLRNWHSISPGQEVHGFVIRHVDGDVLKIGCHDFMRAEIEAFATILDAAARGSNVDNYSLGA